MTLAVQQGFDARHERERWYQRLDISLLIFSVSNDFYTCFTLMVWHADPEHKDPDLRLYIRGIFITTVNSFGLL
jgi:hypothetical protein